MVLTIKHGDCRNVLRAMPDQSVHCCVTSPPYFGLRDYGHAGQIGMESTPDAFVAEMVAPNPMPESVTDRCTKAHEYIFLMSKSARYFYDADAVKEEVSDLSKAVHGSGYKDGGSQHKLIDAGLGHSTGTLRANGGSRNLEVGRNKRSVWEVTTQPFSEAHFATFPPALIEPCILAGCPEGGTVLDPFGGAGTTGLVADRLQRNAVLIELNTNYAAMSERRLRDDAGMFAEINLEGVNYV